MGTTLSVYYERCTMGVSPGCFGKYYAEREIECQQCGAQKECKRKMSNGQTLPCWGDYTEKSFACTDACSYGGSDANASVCAKAVAGSEPPEVDPLAPNTAEATPVSAPANDDSVPEATEVTEPVASSIEPVAASTEPVAASTEPVAEPIEPVAASAESVAEPVRLPRKPKVTSGKLKKKDIIITALDDAPEDGIGADDIVALIEAAELAVAANSDKTRHYVIMTISGLRKKGWEIKAQNRKYILISKGE